MTTKIEQSWQLFKASLAVTLRQRKLLWFPLVTTTLMTFIALFFLSAIALPVMLHHTGYHLTQKQHWLALKNYYLPEPALKPQPRDASTAATDGLRSLLTGRPASSGRFDSQPGGGSAWGILFWLPLYLLSMFLATFCNVAYYSEIIAALNGKEVSLRRGFDAARSRWRPILAWSLLAGMVGWLLRSIEQRLPFLARLVTGFIGMAWSVAAVFAIPVIIQEQPMRNPFKILQQSALTLKRTWGEGLIGYLGFSAGSAMIFLCSLAPLLLAGGLALLFKSVWLAAVAGAIWVLGLLFMAYLSSVAGNVYRCALFLYAAEGVIPEPYNQDMMDMAWKVKKNSGE